MTTTIRSNGSGRVLPVEALFARLESDTLDRSFEAYGGFINADPLRLDGKPYLPAGGVTFFGNFFTYSHVFSIETDDAELIERLTAAIRANQATAEYLAQPLPKLRAVTWWNPDTNEAGEFLTRCCVEAKGFGDRKRAAGCVVSDTFAWPRPHA